MRQNRNDDLRSRQVLPSVNDPNVLVLQGVKKAARGNYSCKVGNGIPTYNYEVESKPVFLDVKCKYSYNILRNLVDVSYWFFVTQIIYIIMVCNYLQCHKCIFLVNFIQTASTS